MAAYLDNAGLLLVLYRSQSKPLIFKSIYDFLKIGSRIRGPIYIKDMAGFYKRLQESAPEDLKSADIKIRSSGGINNINFKYHYHGWVKEIHFIAAASLNPPDHLGNYDMLDYIDTLRKCAGYYPYSVGAAAHKYFLDHADLHPAGAMTPEQRQFARESFFGGFCYLRPGIGHVRGGFVYDINKLYAHILKSLPLPIGSPREYQGDIPKDPGKFYIHRFRVTAQLLSKKLPFIRLMHDWSVPQGYQSSIVDKELTLCKPDYELFRQNYRILKYQPIGGLEFYSCDYIFKMHVEDTFRLIERTEKPGEIAAYKILINALYGQYGRKDINGRTVYRDGKFSWDENFHTVSNAYVPMASAIAAYGRSLIVPAAQREGSNYIYSDTDSIHTFRPSRYIRTSKNFGEFKLEERFEDGMYFGPRKYVLLLSSSPEKKKVVMAGLPSGSLDKYSYWDIERGEKIPITRNFINPDGSVERINMTYEI